MKAPRILVDVLVVVIFSFPVAGLGGDYDSSGGGSEDSVQWGPLLRQSALFLGVEHGFRLATEAGTREGLHDGGFWSGYVDSVTNLHGWADGDPFLVNSVGHPMQGSIAGDIWIQNDPRYRSAEFGRERRYWVGRLRAAAFSWAYSEQFEIGPLSEASLGHVQHHFPEQGFADHVITPVVGLGWMVAEDFIDLHLIKPIEARTRNRFIRMVARGGLNPSRSFANVLAFREPWRRLSRGGIDTYDAALDPTMNRGTRARTRDSSVPDLGPWKPSTFEFATVFNQSLLGAGGHEINCSGGGANAVYNFNSLVGMEGEVSGCKMLGMPANLSGDANYFMVGPRFSFHGGNRWKSYVHVLFGADKLTEELMNPELKALVEATSAKDANAWDLHNAYTRRYESTGLALQVGGGVEYAINRNFAVRVGELEVNHAWMRDLNGEAYPNTVRLTTGVVLRVGSAR